MSHEDLQAYLAQHYPDTDNKLLAEELGITENRLRKLASRYGIKKSDGYKQELHKKLMQAKEEKYLDNLPGIEPNPYELNIIVGSLIGDGCLGFAPRSRQAFYREHFAPSQRDYRVWKAGQLERLGFKITRDNHLRSPSLPALTRLYHAFYLDNRKCLTTENIKLLTHPVGLACLFMDDGSLVINYSRKKDGFYIFPRLTFYTFAFTAEENDLLRRHLEKTFGLALRLKPFPYGHGYGLDSGRQDTIQKLISLIKPYARMIPSKAKRLDITQRLLAKDAELRRRFGEECRNTTIAFI
ncbi:endonuclease [Moorella sulfitireducens (nom. illeg.)]|uniref:endonuclease n=1 Tax=Neomoorella sulfitireducens TaxID=2972948 RepID=UPI0021AD009C|nr:endonuclease [Moorella sulfitireducens]